MSEAPGFIDRQLGRLLTNAQKQQEAEIKKKLFLTFATNAQIAKWTEIVEDCYLWVDDDSLPIEWRVRELVNLVGRLSTIAEAKEDPIAAAMRSNFHEFVHRFWYARWLAYLQRRRRIGRAMDPLHLPLGKAVELVTRVGEKWVIPMGKDVVDATFGRDFHSPQFVAALQAPPQFPFMPDTRSGGEAEGGREVFAEEIPQT